MDIPGYLVSNSQGNRMKRRADRGNDRRTSKVWNYCTQLSDSWVECNICKKQLSFHNSTSSMREHLFRRHNLRDIDNIVVGTIAATLHQPMPQPLLLPCINSVTSTTANTNMFQPGGPLVVKEEQQESVMMPPVLGEAKRARLACEAPLDVGGIVVPNQVSNLDITHSHAGYGAISVDIGNLNDTSISEKRAGLLTDLILEMVFRDMQPLSVVEERGFGLLLKCLEPHYHVPNPSQLGSLLWHRYDAFKKHLQQHLQSALAPRCLTLCTEYWQSVAGCEVGSGGRLFLTISAHFVDKDWNLVRCVLETVPMPDFKEESSGHGLALFGDTLKAVLSEFHLPENFVFCVVHNNQWMSEAREATEEMGCEKNLNTAGPSVLLHSFPKGSVALHCAGEALKLCIQAGLGAEPVREALAEVRRIVSHFQHDAHAAAALSLKAQAANKAGVSLVLDDPGRWATAIDLCESLLELKWVVSSVLEEQKAAANLTDHQWRLLQELVPMLRTVRIAASFLSEDINAPISSLMPCLHGVSRVLEQHIAESGCPVARGVVERVHSGMERCWSLGEEEALLDSPAVLSTFLDPRFKELRFLSLHARSKLHDKVKELLSAQAQVEDEGAIREGESDREELGEGEEERAESGLTTMDFNNSRTTLAHPDSPVSCGPNEEVDIIVLQPNVMPRTLPLQAFKGALGKGSHSSSTVCLQKRTNMLRDSQNIHRKETSLVPPSMYDILLGEDPTERMPEIHQQLENYIAEPLCKRSLSPLQWWCSKEHRFPAVARLARRYLAIPATAVPANSAFSARETPVAQRRATLGPQHLDHILFLHQNCDYVEQLMGRSIGRERGADKHGRDQTRETLYQSLVSYESNT